MPADAPVVIVGAGLAGAAAAGALAARWVPVVVLEQYSPGHPHGGSHGSARIVRRAYRDPFYAGLTARALERWVGIEHTAGRELIRWHGALDFGAGRHVAALADTLAATGAEHEVLTADAAGARWPGMRFNGDVVFHPQAGTLDADAAVDALLSLARDAGADVRSGTRVTSVDDGGVRTADGTHVPARCVVVAAGGWASGLLGGVAGMPPLSVTRQSVFHFARREPAERPWPSTIHELPHTAYYHLAGGRDGGADEDRKLGIHDPGPVVRAGGGGAVDPAARERAVDYVRRWLPGLVPAPGRETTCLYTTTPTQDFVLDRVGSLVVCSPCSGHGAKFAPSIGEWVADLVTGRDGVPDRFRLATHAAPGATAGDAHVSL